MQRFRFSPDSLRRRTKSGSRERNRRRLRAEALESRQLLAADFFHNHFDPEDVNDDGRVSAIDALAVINSMNRQSRSDESLFTDVNADERQTAVDALMVVNRIRRGRDGVGDQRVPIADQPLPSFIDEFRSVDGTGNNLDSPQLGAAGENLLRIAEADYSDRISAPAGTDRPSAREISNLLSDAEGEGIRNERDLTAFLYVWGQFLDHDIDLSLSPHDASTGEAFDIVVPTDDPLFNPSGDEDVVIPLIRSQYDPATGTSIDNPRQQFNAITSYIDGSQVYGSDQQTADALREFAGGRLLIRDNGLLPLDVDGNVMTGDIRAAENLSLTAMHSLFVREHNRLADQIADANPDLSDEEIYQQARAIVIAEIQSITYNEFLPALLGNRALNQYEGYDSSVNPSIANEFSTAAFRFGHSTLNDDIEFFGNDGRAVSDEVALADAFFNPQLLDQTGIDSLLKYNASSLAQEIDLQVVDGLRNFLFGPPGAGGLDLAALNIQRGRDHGLADYNSTRVAYGLNAYDSFADLTSDGSVQEKLQSLYGDINDLDLWVGLLAEDHLPDASVGELTSAIIVDQFQRLRDGDRLFYQNVFNRDDIRLIERSTLAEIIERNTNADGLQGNVFFFRAEVRGRVTTSSADVTGDRDRRRRASSSGVEGVVVELLGEDDEILATTSTNRRGQYRFGDFAETGDYQLRLAESGETLDLLVSTGDVRLSGLDFELS